MGQGWGWGLGSIGCSRFHDEYPKLLPRKQTRTSLRRPRLLDIEAEEEWDFYTLHSKPLTLTSIRRGGAGGSGGFQNRKLNPQAVTSG